MLNSLKKSSQFNAILALLLLPIALPIHAATVTFKDNLDVNLVLAKSNYNRLVVKNDKIIRAYFPNGTMAISNDEDGSLYVTLAANVSQPFTLFLSTESGRHFSATVSAEESLGKTIEFVPHVVVAKASPVINKALPRAPALAATTIPHLMNQMLTNAKPIGFVHKQSKGRMQRLNQGLMLTPKEAFISKKLTGEILELYNGGKTPLMLKEAWFADKKSKAVALSQALVLPGQKVLLYRVQENAHA